MEHIKWGQYIDDIFPLWPWGVTFVQGLMKNLNDFHPTMIFTHEFSDTNIKNVLDVTVFSLPGISIQTDTFSKPPDTH